MNIKPVRCVAMIKPDEVQSQTKGGLYIPDTVREKQSFAVQEGEVIAIGDGFFDGLHGPIPKVGDKVIFDRYAGSLITIEDKKGKREKYRLVNDDKIVAILEE